MAGGTRHAASTRNLLPEAPFLLRSPLFRVAQSQQSSSEMMVSCTRGGRRLPLAPCQPRIRHVLYSRVRMNCCAPLPASRPDRPFSVPEPKPCSSTSDKRSSASGAGEMGRRASCAGNRKEKLKAYNSGPRRLGRIVVRIHGVALNPLSWCCRTLESFRTGPACGLTQRLQSKGDGDGEEKIGCTIINIYNNLTDTLNVGVRAQTLTCAAV